MTTENNTTQAPAATLNEKELFAEFFGSAVSTYDTRGKMRSRHDVADLLEVSTFYSEIDLCIVPDEVEDPTELLGAIEYELHGALLNLQHAREAWEDFKAERLIHEDKAIERYSVAEETEAA